jgi:hypothetical protein
MTKEITIQIGDRDQPVTVDNLVAALENTLQMLKGLESHFPHSGEPIQWEIVRALMKSPLSITLAPRPPKGQKRLADKVVKAAIGGLKTLETSGEPQLPPHFDDEVLEAVEKLSSISQTGTALKVFVPDEEAAQVELGQQTIKRVKELEARARVYVDYGTIEGRLETISVHNGNSFVVWEAMTNNRIECRITPEQLEEAKQLLGKRVAISGRLRYRNHKPISMEVESIKVLRERAELPQPETMKPIDITGGESSEEYIRRLRNAR